VKKCWIKIGKKPFVDSKGNLKMKGSSFFAVATGSWASHGEYDYKYIQGTKETAEMLREQLGEAVLMNPDIDNEICIRTRKTQYQYINTRIRFHISISASIVNRTIDGNGFR
jgi:hypothetical protein